MKNEINCWNCANAKMTTEAFYEYGEDSEKGEAGENYDIECPLHKVMRRRQCKDYKEANSL